MINIYFKLKMNQYFIAKLTQKNSMFILFVKRCNFLRKKVQLIITSLSYLCKIQMFDQTSNDG